MNMMRAAYNICAAESGQGSFKRMKEHMTGHVELTRHTMFRKAAQKVDEDLEAMCKTLQGLMGDKVSRIFDDLDKDYTSALGDQPTRVLTKEEREVRSATCQILKSIDAQFEPIANGDLSSVNAATATNTRGEEPVDESAEEHDSMEDSEQESSGDSEQESSEEAGEESS
ncbi:hypothetical protein COCMIDRAFT_31153 [Bipolaris oryzae ATCC 44560]|uniref:DUF7605 domain-containing protein n=1 Tax=Bipolaris oryzae ATCC 44560 TaxID=930090 RepID=W6YQ85_COCMI|nr:uncharacterized protein COCMIDRAFT_31153 [Bipolaris oryzae ATCC 44560]EUC39780.1 hypothetical protein COCMIDRAFT_31153 [Bipolaris oryzae ATCC 44560]